MPKNKRESLIYTFLMCFTMVLWMSIYNVAMHQGSLSANVVKDAWIGFPVAYIFAMLCDWFIVSGLAKKVAFTCFVKPGISSSIKTILAVSCCMVVPMVLIMSFYGAAESCVRTGDFSSIILIWLANIPKNFIMALPFQLVIAGPLVRFVFRKAFPEGSVL